MQIKTTMKDHLTLVRLVVIKRSTDNKGWRGCGGKGTLLHCWWECKLGYPLWRTRWRFLKKLEIELPYNWGNTHCTHPEETRIERDTYTPVLAAALFTMVGQGDSLDAHRQTDGWAGCGTRTQRCHSAKKTTPSSQFQWGGWNWSLLYTVK